MCLCAHVVCPVEWRLIFLSADPFYDGWASGHQASAGPSIGLSLDWCGSGWVCERRGTDAHKRVPAPVRAGAVLALFGCSSRERARACVRGSESVRKVRIAQSCCFQKVGLHICGPAQTCPEEGSQASRSVFCLSVTPSGSLSVRPVRPVLPGRMLAYRGMVSVSLSTGCQSLTLAPGIILPKLSTVPRHSPRVQQQQKQQHGPSSVLPPFLLQ